MVLIVQIGQCPSNEVVDVVSLTTTWIKDDIQVDSFIVFHVPVYCYDLGGLLIYLFC